MTSPFVLCVCDKFISRKKYTWCCIQQVKGLLLWIKRLFVVSSGVFYPWVMCILTVRIMEAFGLPKLSLFCSVQRDVASLLSYSKLNSKHNHWNSHMLLRLLLIGSC